MSESSLRVYTDFIERWGVNDEKHKHDTFTVLSVFAALVGFNSAPSRRIQSTILGVIMSPGYSRVALTYHDINFSEEDFTEEIKYKEREILLEECRQVPGMQLEDKHLRLAYHAAIVRLLARCCANEHSVNMIRCADILPFPLVFKVIESILFDAQSNPPNVPWKDDPACRGDISIYQVKGIIVADWGHLLVLDAFCEYFHTVFLSRNPEEDCTTTMRVKVLFPQLVKVLGMIATILERYTATVLEHYTMAKEEKGMQVIFRDEELSRKEYHSLKIGGIAGLGRCPTLTTWKTMDLVYGALVGVVSAFYRRYDDFVPADLDPELSSSLESVETRLHHQVHVLAESRAHIDHIGRVMGICGWFAMHVFEQHRLPAAMRCFELIDERQRRSTLVSINPFLAAKKTYFYDSTFYLEGKREDQRRMDTDLLEGTDFTSIDELHSNGILLSSLAPQSSVREIESKCESFGDIRLTKQRSSGTAASVYFEAHKLDGEIGSCALKDVDMPPAVSFKIEVTNVAFEVDLAFIRPIDDTAVHLPLICLPTNRRYVDFAFNKSDTVLAVLGRIQGITGIHVVDLKLFVDGIELRDNRLMDQISGTEPKPPPVATAAHPGSSPGSHARVAFAHLLNNGRPRVAERILEPARL